MRPLFIIGYMASGKTTFGRALAKSTNREFIDLDFYIEQRFRLSIADIFTQRGESGFRDIEQRMLREVGEFEDVVIACGGGTPCFFDNIDYMLRRGNVVLLDTSVDRITQRLIINSNRRPLMRGKTSDEIRKAVEEGLAARDSIYSKAQILFCGEELENRRQIDRSVSLFLTQNPDI